MQATHAKLIEALDRVEGFLSQNPGVLEGVITSTAHQNFSASRARVVEHLNAQDENARVTRASVVTKSRLRARLIRKHMRPIAAVARAQLPNAPELQKLTVPPRNQQFAALVTAGQGMARAAKLYESTFIAAGLPPDFIEKLVASTDALNESITTKGQTAARRARATAGLTSEARTARNHLRVLDSMVRAAVDDDDGLLAQWRSIRRVVVAATSPAALAEPVGVTGNTGTPTIPSGGGAAPDRSPPFAA